MKSIAIIPARGGSKRIPRKNVKDFLGKPIIAYSIEMALTSGLFDEVMVSSDDDEVLEVAQRFGAKVPFKRSPRNSDDFATTAEVLEEVLSNYKNINKNFEYGCCIYPTAPLIQLQHLQLGLRKLSEQNYDTVFPAVAFSFPVWRGFEITEGGKMEMLWPEFVHSRTQDLKKVYHDAGQWYWFRADRFNKKLLTDNTGVICLEEDLVQDIDELSDWKIAEMKYRATHGG